MLTSLRKRIANDLLSSLFIDAVTLWIRQCSMGVNFFLRLSFKMSSPASSDILCMLYRSVAPKLIFIERAT